jgi:hypothetical protein
MKRVIGAYLLGFAGYMFVIGLAAAAPTSGELLGPIPPTGAIDCNGQIFNADTPSSHGLVAYQLTGSNQLQVFVSLVNGDPNQLYSIEIFESTPNCGSDNQANTGNTLQTDASGKGTASLTLTLPYPSLGGAVIGDGAGTESLVLVLDTTLSTGAGDRFATGPIPLPSRGRPSTPR